MESKTQENINWLVDQLKAHPASKYGTKEAERLADNVLEAGKWDSHKRSIPVKTIAECFGFKVYAQKRVPDGTAGNIYVGGTTEKIYGHGRIIITCKDEEFAHQRFIIAHELGHYLMDYVGSPLEQTPKKLFAQAYTKENHGTGDMKEMRADKFATELLMPAKEFMREYAKIMKAVEYDERFAIPTLAVYFGVKPGSVEKRILETGLA